MQSGTITMEHGQIQKIEICFPGVRYRVWKEDGRVRGIELFSGKEIDDFSSVPPSHAADLYKATTFFFHHAGPPISAVDPTMGGQFRIGSLNSCNECDGIAGN